MYLTLTSHILRTIMVFFNTARQKIDCISTALTIRPLRGDLLGQSTQKWGRGFSTSGDIRPKPPPTAVPVNCHCFVLDWTLIEENSGGHERRNSPLWRYTRLVLVKKSYFYSKSTFLQGMWRRRINMYSKSSRLQQQLCYMERYQTFRLRAYITLQTTL